MAKSGLLEFRGFRAKFFFHYTWCSLPIVCFLPFMYVFVIHNENIRPLREKGWSVKVNWEGDTAENIRYLASFFTYIIYSTHYSSLVSISPYFTDEGWRLREIMLVALGYSDGKLDSLATLRKWLILYCITVRISICFSFP